MGYAVERPKWLRARASDTTFGQPCPRRAHSDTRSRGAWLERFFGLVHDGSGYGQSVPTELPELCGVNLSTVRARSQFAVVETTRDGQRVLCFMDDPAEATELAAELRRRGVGAGAFRTGR